MKTHEVPKANRSIRMHNHLPTRNNNNNNNNLNPLPQQQCAVQQTSEAANKIQQPRQRPSIEIQDCNEGMNGHKIEELRFIDTTSCCDTPNFAHRRSVQISIENIPLQSPSSLSPTTIAAESAATTIISLENEVQRQFNSIDANVGTNVQQAVTKPTHDMGVDSAVEDSTVSLEQVGVFHKLRHNLLKFNRIKKLFLKIKIY
jgi:hypothetical protein